MGYGPGGMDMGYGPDGMMGGSGMGYGSMYPPAPPMPAGMYGPGGYGGSGMPPITPAPSPPYSMGGSPGDGGSPGMGDGKGDGGSPYGSGRRLSHEGPYASPSPYPMPSPQPVSWEPVYLGPSCAAGCPAGSYTQEPDLMSVLANPAPCEALTCRSLVWQCSLQIPGGARVYDAS